MTVKEGQENEGLLCLIVLFVGERTKRKSKQTDKPIHYERNGYRQAYSQVDKEDATLDERFAKSDPRWYVCKMAIPALGQEQADA